VLGTRGNAENKYGTAPVDATPQQHTATDPTGRCLLPTFSHPKTGRPARTPTGEIRESKRPAMVSRSVGHEQGGHATRPERNRRLMKNIHRQRKLGYDEAAHRGASTGPISAGMFQ